MFTNEVEAAKIHQTLAQHILVDGFHLAIDLAKSHGSWLYDALEKRELLDFYSYFASLPIGHNHPEMTKDKEFLERLQRAAIANPSNSDIYTSEFATFVKTFAETAKPPEFTHLFFIAGGALAVENGLKAAFDWKVRKNRKLGLEKLGFQILHFKEAFHGRSGYTLSLTNTDPTKTRHFPKFSWPRIINPKLSFPLTSENIKKTIDTENQALAAIKEAFAKNKNDIAAIIIEPIQGEGGGQSLSRRILASIATSG